MSEETTPEESTEESNSSTADKNTEEIPPEGFSAVSRSDIQEEIQNPSFDLKEEHDAAQARIDAKDDSLDGPEVTEDDSDEEQEGTDKSEAEVAHEKAMAAAKAKEDKDHKCVFIPNYKVPELARLCETSKAKPKDLDVQSIKDHDYSCVILMNESLLNAPPIGPFLKRCHEEHLSNEKQAKILEQREKAKRADK